MHQLFVVLVWVFFFAYPIGIFILSLYFTSESQSSTVPAFVLHLSKVVSANFISIFPITHFLHCLALNKFMCDQPIFLITYKSFMVKALLFLSLNFLLSPVLLLLFLFLFLCFRRHLSRYLCPVLLLLFIYDGRSYVFPVLLLLFIYLYLCLR